MAGSKPLPAPPTDQTPLPAPCVEAIDMMRLHQEWEYSIIQPDDRDEQTWSDFRAKFSAITEEQLKPKIGAGIDTMKDALFLDWVEDKERLSGADIDVVREYCHKPEQELNLPLMTLPIVLMVDCDVIESLLNYERREVHQEAPDPEKRWGIPWIWAIDLDIMVEHNDDDGLDDTEECDDEEYQGRLKISVHSLINEFFLIVAMAHLHMDELAPDEDDDGVWHSII